MTAAAAATNTARVRGIAAYYLRAATDSHGPLAITAAILTDIADTPEGDVITAVSTAIMVSQDQSVRILLGHALSRLS